MAQLKDLLVTGPSRLLNDLYVTTDIYENGTALEDKYGASLSLSGYTLGLKTKNGDLLNSITIPSITYSAGDGIAISSAHAISVKTGTGLTTDGNDAIAVDTNTIATQSWVTGKGYITSSGNTWRPVKYGSTTVSDKTTTLEFVAGNAIDLTFASGKLTINHESYGDGYASGLYKVTIDSYGHIESATATAKADITSLLGASSSGSASKYLNEKGTFTTPTNTTYGFSGSLSNHAFTSTLTAGGSGTTSVLTLAAGNNITLTDDTTNKKITITATVPTITLNGTATTSPSFYAPTSAGTSGQYLKSNGTGAPTWANFPTIGTVTSVAASGSGGITISGSPITTSGRLAIGLNLSTAINGLSEGLSPAERNDYIVAQYAGGGATTYHRRKLSNIFAALAASDIPTLTSAKISNFDSAVDTALGINTSSGDTAKFLNAKGGWTTPAGTIYSAGDGITVSGTVISAKYGTGLTTDGNDALAVDTTTIALKSDIKTYTAGTGIAISSANAISNSGVRAVTINGNNLRVNTNGTNADLTIPYATSAGSAPASDVYAWAKAATKPTYTASEVGAVATSGDETIGGNKTFSGITVFQKTIRDVNGQHYYGGAANRSQWYKITLPYYGITPPTTSDQWYMCSMTIHIAGDYNSCPHGTIELCYYIKWNKSSRTFSPEKVVATGYGPHINKAGIYYKLSDPFIFYVNTSTPYTSIWVDYVSYRDSAQGHNTKETKVETTSAITVSEYSSVPISSLFTADGSYMRSSDSFIPEFDNSLILGHSDYRWANVYSAKFNGYILAAACAKGVDTSISAGSTSTNLPTSQAVATFVEGKGYLTSVSWANVSGHDAGVDSDLGISSSGSTTKFLTQKGTWATPTGATYSAGTAIDISSSNEISVEYGTGLQLDDGNALEVNTSALTKASTSAFGVMKVGTGLSASSGTVSVNTANCTKASTSAFGVMKVGTGLSASSGTVSVNTANCTKASTSAFGVMKVGTNLVASGGVVSLAPSIDERITALEQQICLIEGTKIKMADGSEKNIEDVQTGDMVLSYNPAKAEQIPAMALKSVRTGVAKDFDVLVYENGNYAEMYQEHSIYDTALGYPHSHKEWNVGDEGLMVDGPSKLIRKTTSRHAIIKERFVLVTSTGLYYANGILMGIWPSTKYNITKHSCYGLNLPDDILNEFKREGELNDRSNTLEINPDFLKRSKTLQTTIYNLSKEIEDCKKNLLDTDYIVTKFTEGLISAAEWLKSKASRANWRSLINKDEGPLAEAMEQLEALKQQIKGDNPSLKDIYWESVTKANEMLPAFQEWFENWQKPEE